MRVGVPRLQGIFHLGQGSGVHPAARYPIRRKAIAVDLAQAAMALYKHVANKEELLDGMIDAGVGEIDPPVRDTDWKSAVRQRNLSARRTLQRHPGHAWGRHPMETRSPRSPTVRYERRTRGVRLHEAFVVLPERLRRESRR